MAYYKVTCSELNQQLQDKLKERKEGFKRLHEWAEKHGAELGTNDSLGGVSCGFKFPKSDGVPKDRANWKKVDRSSSTWWTPKWSTKKGKQLAEEIQKLSHAVPSHFDLGRLFGLNAFQAPGIKSRLLSRVSEKRQFFVDLPKDFKHNKKTKGKLKRITDIQWERIE